MAFYFYLSTKIIMVFITKSYQDLFGVRSYINAKYEVIDGVRVRRGNETKDWCGPINAGVTLVWKLF